MSTTATPEFQDAMRARGIMPPDSVIPDGRIHRFRGEGDRHGNKSAWYVLYGDGIPAGAFGDWRLGEHHQWCGLQREARSEAEDHQFQRRIEQARQAREVLETEEHRKAAAAAAKIWAKAKEADPAHPYLKAKGIQPYGARQAGDRLVIPVSTSGGAMVGLQYIAPDGTKRFHPGTPKKGACCVIGGEVNGIAIVCEGFATGATLYEATNKPVIIAFDCGNLQPVCKAIRTGHPDSKIMVAADNDHRTQGNPGLSAATKAAEATGGTVIAPKFTDVETGSDWNDWAKYHGIEAVRDRFTVTPFELAAPPAKWRELTLPVRHFALGHAFPLGCASLLHAMGGGGKSMLLLISFVSVCIERTLVPGWNPAKAGRVLYLALEDDTPEILRRLQRVAFVFDLTPSECNLVSENLRILTPAGGVDFFRRGPGNSITTGPDFERLRLAIEEQGPFEIIALDPKSALLGGVLDENDNPTAQKVMNLLTALAGPDTAVVISDHVAKADRENSTSARGGGAWSDAARQAWALRPLTDVEKRDAGPGYDPALLVALELRKSNYTAPARPLYFARRTQPEGAGVLEAIDFEAARQGAAEDASRRIQRAILEVLEGNDCTKGELTGKHGTRENLAHATNVRALIGEIADTKVTARSVAAEIESMLAAGLLKLENDSNTARKVLKVCQ